MPTPVQPTSRPDTPRALWDAVLRARRVLDDRRREPPGPLLTGAREVLLDALEAYTASLEKAGRPIPYLLREELRIQQRTVRPIRGRKKLRQPGLQPPLVALYDRRELPSAVPGRGRGTDPRVG
jgi:hypothetical protein